MLSAADLAAMRAAQLATMTDSCEIQRMTSLSDGMGGTTEVWAVAATVPCRVGTGAQPFTGIIAGQAVEILAWRVTLPALTDVRKDDRLKVGNRGYEVLGVLSPKTRETACIALTVERDVMIIEPPVIAGFIGLDYSQARNSVYKVIF